MVQKYHSEEFSRVDLGSSRSPLSTYLPLDATLANGRNRAMAMTNSESQWLARVLRTIGHGSIDRATQCC